VVVLRTQCTACEVGWLLRKQTLTTTIGVEHAWASIDQEAEDDVV
jgi:hypothetical protein